MNILTEARLALIARLGLISTGNGYLTNVGGNVVSGWFNEVIDKQPIGAGLVVVQRAPDGEPVRGPEAVKLRRGFRVIAAVEAGVVGYESALEDLELDLVRCLMPCMGQHVPWLPKGCAGFAVGRAESFPPGDGQPAATLLIPVTIDIIVNDSGL